MRRKLLFFISLIMLTSVLLSACSGGNGNKDVSNNGNEIIQLKAGGAGTTSWSYSCLVAVSEAIKKFDPTLDLIVQSTPGSTTHYAMLRSGELDLGSGFTPTDYWAKNVYHHYTTKNLKIQLMLLLQLLYLKYKL